ncbi:helix-turn-helix transcriptional regulator [Rudaeicoccus suwonensis]|uniref:Regulatory LuxR family protein n=1 Tax=Rudaeicoccus suwonensis TaxID=657409 RepID=A0A561EAE3_9MICO|nr:helix-turn-helix transcriptional regulator [Rudaeicoccus suwonensis]TWE12580.1 regulatory LuxR family protein [Rudaeicoccus suwonensis]
MQPPALPEPLSARERSTLRLALVRWADLPQRASAVRIWDECRVALAQLVRLNVCYVVAIDPVRCTHTIEHVHHPAAGAETGIVGGPYGAHGLCARLLSSNTDYRYDEDNGRVFRTGFAHLDEFKARDAAAVHIYRPDGSLYGGFVASSLIPRQFTPHIREVMKWLAASAAIYRLSPSRRFEPLLYYPQLEEGELVNWVVDTLAAIRSSIHVASAHVRNDAAEAALGFLKEADALCFDAQGYAAATYGSSTDLARKLTARERQVMALLAADTTGHLTNARIAEQLGTSTANVKKIVASAIGKCEVRTRHDLRRLAFALRL